MAQVRGYLQLTSFPSERGQGPLPNLEVMADLLGNLPFFQENSGDVGSANFAQ